MAKIVFYQQARDDGGTHTGVEVDGITYFDWFQIEGEEYDPTLTWYVEVYCDGDSLPTTGPAALQWLLDQAPLFRTGLTQLAAKLQVGLDHNTIPLDWALADAPAGVSVRILCDAARRLVGRDMAKHVAELAEHWEELLKRLPEAHTYTL